MNETTLKRRCYIQGKSKNSFQIKHYLQPTEKTPKGQKIDFFPQNVVLIPNKKKKK